MIVMEKLSWYFHRLSKMPPAEIIHRLHHRLFQHWDENFSSFTLPTALPSQQVDLSRLSRLSRHAGPEDIGQWQEQLSVSLVELAERSMANTFDIFGIESAQGESVNWHLDPKTGREWPLQFWSKVKIRDGSKVGGVKFVWEINRLYSLPILGMAYRLTGERRYADAIFILLGSWLEANPYPLGVNWTSGIELGIRVANLTWALSFLVAYEIGETDRRVVNTFMQLHGYHLYRYPSKYSSNNNHALAEALGLFLAAVFFPQLKGAGKWRVYGKTVLEREVMRQILHDGGSYEYTTTYLSFTADFFLLYRMVCIRLDIPYDRCIDKQLERSCAYIHQLMDCQGNVPNIGDQDSAILVNFGLTNHENYISLLNTGSMLFGRTEFGQGRPPDFKTAILLGDIDDSVARNVRATSASHSLLRKSGLAVIRAETAGQELVFVGNATPLGMPPLYAHGHLDALSFTLAVGGHEVFVDPGTYLYHSGAKWRHYFRSTAAHNTLRVDGVELTEQPGPFMFGSPYQVTDHTLIEDDHGITWQASHNAYQQRKEAVHLCRKVQYDYRAGMFTIEDSLRSKAEYLVEQFFHFHPDCHVELQERGAMISVGEGIRVHLSFDHRMEVKLYKGSHDPLAGWFSPAFNCLQECSSIVTCCSLSGLSVLRTEITVTMSDATYDGSVKSPSLAKDGLVTAQVCR